MMFYERPVRFEEVDGANIVFFARYVHYAHEAMEHFFSPLEGGYPHLTMVRRVGFPAVHMDTKWLAPLRYGDTVHIETTVPRIGKRSFSLRYRMQRAARAGEASAAVCEIVHDVVTCDLVDVRSIDMPGDVRAQIERHLETPT
jgi:4-hydroxybenzoyl-CoA thioesterase